MYAQNRPPVYANGTVVIMGQPRRPSMGSGTVMHTMPPAVAAMRSPVAAGNRGPGVQQPMNLAPASSAIGFGAAPGQRERFLPVIQAQRPPYMQQNAARKAGPQPYMGAFGSRQVFAPQPPSGPAQGRGASAPRPLPNGFIPIHPAAPGSAAMNRSSRDPLGHSASQSNGFTSDPHSTNGSRSGTIVIPFSGPGNAGPADAAAGSGMGMSPNARAVSLRMNGSMMRTPQARQHQQQYQQQQLPSLMRMGSNCAGSFGAPASSTFRAISTLGSDAFADKQANDTGDVFTPIVDDDSESGSDSGSGSDSSRSVVLVSESDSSPNGQYALSPELAMNLNEYEEGEVQEYLPNVYFCGTRNCNKVLGMPGRPQNSGYDDEKNHYLITVGDHIGYRFEIQKELGRGTFGVVVRAYDHKEQREVAVKIIKNKPSYTKQAKEEVDVLYNLQADDPNDAMNVVRLLHTFTFRNHFIIVFELLSIDLYNMVYKNGFRAMPMEFIYDFAEQMLTALQFVRQHNIVHCDFKPENIVVCHQTSLSSPGTNLKRLKLIDFGSACFENRRVHTYIQSRYYRAPEVVLGIPYTAAIDMWSFGCVVCELANGYPIFPGASEGDLLQRMVEYLGHVPVSVQEKGKRSSTFYEEGGMQMRPKLSTMPSSAGVVPAKPHRFTGAGSKSLAAYLQSARRDRDDLFIDFVQGCLEYDPEQRLTPSDALCHPWMEKWRLQRSSRRTRGR